MYNLENENKINVSIDDMDESDNASVATTVPMNTTLDCGVVFVKDGFGGKEIPMSRAQVLACGGTIQTTRKGKLVGRGLKKDKLIGGDDDEDREDLVQILCPDKRQLTFVTRTDATALGVLKFISRPHQKDYGVGPWDDYEEEPPDGEDLDDLALKAADEEDLRRPDSPVGSLKDFVGNHPDDQGLLEEDGDYDDIASSVADHPDGTQSSLGSLGAQVDAMFSSPASPHPPSPPPSTQPAAPRSNVILRKSKELNRLWHAETQLVFESAKDRSVIGKFVDGVLVKLTEKDIKTCKKWKFKVAGEKAPAPPPQATQAPPPQATQAPPPQATDAPTPFVVLVERSKKGAERVVAKFTGVEGDVPAPTMHEACIAPLLGAMIQDGLGDEVDALNHLLGQYWKTLKLHRRVCHVDDLLPLTTTSTAKTSKKRKAEEDLTKNAAKAWKTKNNANRLLGLSRMKREEVDVFLAECESNIIPYDEWLRAETSVEELQVDFRKEEESCNRFSSPELLKAKLKLYGRKLKRNQLESMKMAFLVGRMCHFLRQRGVLTWDQVEQEMEVPKTTLKTYEAVYEFLNVYRRFFRVHGLAYTTLMNNGYKDKLVKKFKDSKELAEVWSDIRN